MFFRDPKGFWRTIKSILQFKSKTTSQRNSSTTDSKAKANNFCKYFSSAAAAIKSHAIKLKNFVWSQPKNASLRTTNTFRFSYVSMTFVMKELKKIKRNKSTGPDELPPSFLRDCASVIARPLHHLINLSISTGVIPREWKVAKVTPIFKSGKIDVPSNYRPISVLPVLSKILEKAVHHQLIEYLENNLLLMNTQFGYRKQRSTEIASTLFIDDVRKAVDKGKLVGALYIDLSKAFDTIGHAILLEKIKSYGISGVELDWFSNYLFQRYQSVCVDGEKSELEAVKCGVPQGSILGPLLFLLLYRLLRIRNLFENDHLRRRHGRVFC